MLPRHRRIWALPPNHCAGIRSHCIERAPHGSVGQPWQVNDVPRMHRRAHCVSVLHPSPPYRHKRATGKGWQSRDGCETKWFDVRQTQAKSEKKELKHSNHHYKISNDIRTQKQISHNDTNNTNNSIYDRTERTTSLWRG